MARLRNPFDPATLAGSARAVAVIGLGRFGTALALELMDYGTEVLGIDGEERAQELNGRLTHVVIGDATKPELLDQLGIGDFDRVVVAIGSDVTASILVTSQLLRLGVRDIWAKAVSEQHATILDQLGVQHVVRPEADMGRRVAHMVQGSLEDFIEIETGYAAMKIPAPLDLLAVPLRELGIHRHGVSIVAVKRGEDWIQANQETRFERGDVVLVAGPTPKLEAFAARKAAKQA
ncbi:potassium channel family protein [Agrococcus terreus]|uniref:Potassium transporter n=1 Tax=Agrococcus terreus TaxID=574649 RepID=A0ABQ2KL18_9MICO|nr:TrkA family potassium uptake protein [Agrococcus terreus]GGN85028.1 potassium transporter [Agrococcus terreus]